jgi:hypothetical protein
MRSHPTRLWGPPAGRFLAALALVIAVPTVAAAQYAAPSLEGQPLLGEKYHVEFSGTLWNPSPSGLISSEQFGIVGSNIDFNKDLGFTATRFKDMRIVLRPSKKQKFHIEYTPMSYYSATALDRSVVFNGINFNVQLPIQATFGWNVWRFGYEYDFLYKPRYYVGMLLEARLTTMNAQLASPIDTEFTTVRAPLPSIGVVGRAYVLPEVAVNFELSGLCGLQNASGQISATCTQTPGAKYQASYFDWNIYGTVNLTNYVGAQVGWRRITTLIDINQDTGNVKFQGLWFGGVVRY